MEYGKIIAKAEIIDCIEMTDSWIEKLRHDNPIEFIAGYYSPKRFAWILDNVQSIEPIECNGHLGLWNYDNVKALSIINPHSELIRMGLKKIETRSWKTEYRGLIYIHSSKTKIPAIVKSNAKLMNLLKGRQNNEKQR